MIQITSGTRKGHVPFPKAELVPNPHARGKVEGYKIFAAHCGNAFPVLRLAP